MNVSLEQLPPHITELARSTGLGAPLRVFARGLSDGKLFAKYRLVCVFEHGCIRGNADNDRTDHFRWDKVEKFVTRIVRKTVNGRYTSTTYTYEFRLADRRVALAGVSTRAQTSGIEGFGDVVDPLVTARLLPGAAERMRRGEVLEFGAFQIRPDGLRRTSLFPRTLPWPELVGAEVAEGDVIVRSAAKKRPWSQVPVFTVPNVSVFLRLLSLKKDGAG